MFRYSTSGTLYWEWIFSHLRRNIKNKQKRTFIRIRREEKWVRELVVAKVKVVFERYLEGKEVWGTVKSIILLRDSVGVGDEVKA